jgi:hypothetical protein
VKTIHYTSAIPGRRPLMSHIEITETKIEFLIDLMIELKVLRMLHVTHDEMKINI